MRLPSGLDTPAVVVDAERMDGNIARMSDAMRERGVGLRPHAKTHKSVNIARRQLAAGATGITVSTLGEAVVFADAGIEDLFVAYPIVAIGPKAARLRALRERARILAGVESEAGARLLGENAPGLEVLIEVDCGQHRTGRHPDEVADVARVCAAAGLVVVGVFTHGGHSYAPGAAEHVADEEVDALARAADALRDAGFEPRVVSAGSTPTALRSARGAVNEERPGTYVFGDRQQVAIGAHRPDDLALVVAATVVSSEPGRIVLDAGAKALAKDAPASVTGFGWIPDVRDAVVRALYDHHEIVDLPPDVAAPAVGDVVAVVPNHVCPVVNLADELVVVRDGEVVDVWPVDARARSR